MGKKLRKKEVSAAEANLRWEARLVAHKEKLKNAYEVRSRHRSWKDIEYLLDLPEGHEKYLVRPKEDWHPRSYNIARQVEEYITHLFVKYPTPRSLYYIFLSYSKLNEKAHWAKHKDDPRSVIAKEFLRRSPDINSHGERHLFFDWFITIAQGGSFAKHVQGILTKKEAHLFLSAPNSTIEENVWWSRCVSRGMNNNLIKLLYTKIFHNTFVDITTKDSQDIMNFFTKIQDEADLQLCSDLMDFISARYRPRVGTLVTFSLKGRTLGSVVELCNKWHEEIYQRDTERKFSKDAFAIAGFKPWLWESERHNLWHISQIMDVRELRNEGSKMKHCVLSYASLCAAGTTYIFSVKKDGGREVTLELNRVGNTDRFYLAQARGRFNKSLTNGQRNVVSRWAREHLVKTYF